MPADFAAELAHYGPERTSRQPVEPAAAREYCRRLAISHYENFTVASWLLPRRLRPHFYHIYAYCRWADDLADETRNPAESLRLLDWWEEQLTACYAGEAEHPVFVALGETIREFEIPEDPFRDLLVAFRQDQRQNRYDTFDQLLGYCRHSADPVGRLVLYLGRCHSEQTALLSDSICTGLQLANHWQDVARDYDRGRIYLPRETWRRFHYDEGRFARRTADDDFRRMLAFEVGRAESYLNAGWPLIPLVSPELRIDVELFLRGGLAVVEAIRRRRYDVWTRRPTVGKLAKLRLLASAWWKSRD